MDRTAGNSPSPNASTAHLRRLLHAAAYLFLIAILSLSILSAAVFIHVKWAEANALDVAPVLRHYRIVRKLFTNDAAIRLYLSVKNNEKFESTWDFDRGILLSKDLFVSTEMYGEMKYRYRPNIDVYHVAVWSGLQVLNVGRLAASPEFDALLSQCRILRQEHFRTDANGLKKTAFPILPGRPTCFFLGDSFTEGLWVAPEQTFPSLMGEKFVTAGIGLTPVNLGVTGYGALEMAWMLEHYAPELNPDVVVVNLFPNDVHSRFIDVVRGHGVPEENYAHMFHYLDRIRRFCKDTSARLYVAVIPIRLQVESQENVALSAFQDRVQEWCIDNRLPYLDPRENFRTVGPDQIYLSGDPHLSPQGHARYAAFLFQNISTDLLNADEAPSTP